MFKVGGDTEVILQSNTGTLISAIGKIGGSKLFPRKTKHGYVQEDNVLAEFNINPADSEKEFIKNTLDILDDLREIITPLDLSINISPTGWFEKNQLDHPLAMEAGCEPDYDAWNVSVNIPPELMNTTMRSCGGHLHISFDRANETDMSRINMIRVMDLVAGVPSIFMDDNAERRKLYGKAGCHRPKMMDYGHPYDGVEYRTLSNFWIKDTQSIGWAFRAAKRAVENYDELLEYSNSYKDKIISAINSTNKKAADFLINKFDLEVVNA